MYHAESFLRMRACVGYGVDGVLLQEVAQPSINSFVML